MSFLRKLLGPGPRPESSLPPPASGPREVAVLVIDRSESMSEDDYHPTRLDAAKQAGLGFIGVKAERAPQDLVAGVWFCGYADELMPPTVASSAHAAWEDATADLDPFDGTCIGAGLTQARRILVRSSYSYLVRRVILLTDGHSLDPHREAEQLKDTGVVIDAIGIGGSPADVNEHDLKRVASVVDGRPRYRFIRTADELFEYFRRLATDLVK